MTLAAQGDI